MSAQKTRYAYDTATNVKIVAHWCGGCGLPYGLPSGFLKMRQDDGKSWTCPNGCVRLYRKTTEQLALEKAEAELAAARSLAQREAQRRACAEEDARLAREREAHANRRRAAAKGQLTKTKKRVAAGVCPCCNRTFQNVARHMAGQHPEYAGDHA